MSSSISKSGRFDSRNFDLIKDRGKLRWGRESFAGVRLGFRFSTESQTAARREPGTCTVIDRFEAE